jgi:hypothetical protein
MTSRIERSFIPSRVLLGFCVAGLCCLLASSTSARQKVAVDVAAIDHDRILSSAKDYLKEPPVTVTAFSSPRSAGGVHEYFSEGDYWWPDPKNPDGPYIRRDGETNPDNFNKHREAMRRFCDIVSGLTAAYKITDEENYATQAIRHLKAWCVDDATKMYPHLKYAQAIKGRFTGRGTGIIDTIHLIEVARAVEVLSASTSFKDGEEAAIKRWFAEYLQFLTVHQYGIDERGSRNNHGTWWVAQVAAFAHLVNDTANLSYCRSRFKDTLLTRQMAANGSFPEELARTKPYSYSIFNLEGMAVICRILSTTGDNLWEYTLPDGRNMRKAVQFLYPYIVDKSKWPYPEDVMYFDAFPARQPFLLLAGIALGEPRYIETWKKLDADSRIEEVRRSIPIQQPVLWVQ